MSDSNLAVMREVGRRSGDRREARVVVDHLMGKG